MAGSRWDDRPDHGYILYVRHHGSFWHHVETGFGTGLGIAAACLMASIAIAGVLWVARYWGQYRCLLLGHRWRCSGTMMGGPHWDIYRCSRCKSTGFDREMNGQPPPRRRLFA